MNMQWMASIKQMYSEKKNLKENATEKSSYNRSGYFAPKRLHFFKKIVSVQKGFMELKMVNANRRVLMINRKRVFPTRKSFLSDVLAPQKHLKRLFSKLGTCYETLDSKKNMSM